jgi:hypothetical protein
MLISASLNVVECRVLVRSTEAKSDAAYGVDQRIGLIAVDFAANAPDINVNDVGRGTEMQVPDLFQQHCTRHDVPFVAHQVFKDVKFAL